MKKLFVTLAAALISLGASAQLISSNTTVRHRTAKAGYDRLALSYNHIGIEKDFVPESLNGVSFAWTKGIPLSSNIPLYLETGVGLTYGFGSETYEYGDGYYYSDEEDVTFSYLGLTVPVNVTYRFDIPNTPLKISPFAGFYLRGNILGKNSREDGDDYDWFDAEDDDYNAKRLSFGFQLGVGLEVSKLYLGLSYGTDMTTFVKHVDKPSIFSATVGITL